MDNYWEKVQTLNEDKLFEESKNITTKLYAMSEASPMYNQLQGMLDMISERQRDLVLLAREEIDKTPDVLDIGQIDSVVHTPDYTKSELLTYMANFYYDKNGPIVEPKTQQQQAQTPTTQLEQSAPQPAPEQSQEFTIEVPKFGAK
tara:strand:+ start:1322 stop:1759 length:438 start_codon:yes stop_codon:yes gene_type:complete